jgi:hypothetical protein
VTPATLHQELIEAGEAIAADELAAGVIGPSTTAAVCSFQARHTGSDGHALAVDGVVGPATAWALAHPNGGVARYTAAGWRCEPSQAREAVRDALVGAVNEIGACEQPDGSNRGPRVDVFTAPDLGIPWCAAFVSWCYRLAGSPFGRLLSAYKIAEWAKARGRVATDPEPGDLFIILRGDLHGHVGMVAGAPVAGRFCTVEGNAGNAVRGLVRACDAVTLFVRPIPL